MGELLQQTKGEEEQKEPEILLPPVHDCSETESVIDPSTKGKRLHEIISSQNYIVYLITSWVFNAFTVLYSFLNLYLRGLGWDYVIIGAVMSITTVSSAAGRFLGGYVGDVVDRKLLSVFGMFLASIFHLMIGLCEEFILIFSALLVYATIDIAKSGSSAYLMETIPQENSGFALSLFSAGRFLGIVTLIAFSVLTPLLGFQTSFRFMFLISGVILLMCTMGRACFLKGSKLEKQQNAASHSKKFFQENMRAIRYILKTMPLVVCVVVVDAISDSLFKFGALIYANEVLGVSISSINIIMLFTLLLASLLSLKTGIVSDKYGIRKTAIGIYSLMPISALFLLLAPIVPYWAPIAIHDSANTVIMGIGVVFSTAFLAIVLKYVNDALWWLIILVIVKKYLPRKDSSKVLAIFMMLVYFFMSAGPIIGSLLFTFFDPSYLFWIVLVFNTSILCVLMSKSFLNDNVMNNKEKTENQVLAQRKTG